MAQAVLSPGTNYFFWNVSSPVGSGQHNRRDDVELVRFGYKCWARALAGTEHNPPTLNTAIERMEASGEFGDDLQAVIDAHQNARGDGGGDGRVSVAHYADRNHGTFGISRSWLIIILNNAMRRAYPNLYPRIDRAEGIGPAIAQLARTTFVQ